MATAIRKTQTPIMTDKTNTSIPKNHQNCTLQKTNLKTNKSIPKDKQKNNSYEGSAVTENLFRVYHQNIRGLKGKINELELSFLELKPHIICITKHHLKDHEIDITNIPNYKLGAKYCRTKLKNGGVTIYIHDSLNFTTINLQKYTKEQDLEICATQL